MEPEDHLQFASEVFTAYCSRRNIAVPQDFLQLAIEGMVQLQATGRSNILYSLAKGLGNQRSDGSDSLFPCKQLVAGIVEHCINFFAASNVGQVGVVYVCFCVHTNFTCIHVGEMPEGLQTMLQSLFGNCWLNLHSGPMWKVVDRAEQGGPTSLSTSRRIVDVRIGF